MSVDFKERGRNNSTFSFRQSVRKLFTKTKGGLPVEVPLETASLPATVRRNDVDGYGN